MLADVDAQVLVVAAGPEIQPRHRLPDLLDVRRGDILGEGRIAQAGGPGDAFSEAVADEADVPLVSLHRFRIAGIQQSVADQHVDIAAQLLEAMPQDGIEVGEGQPRDRPDGQDGDPAIAVLLRVGHALEDGPGASGYRYRCQVQVSLPKGSDFFHQVLERARDHAVFSFRGGAMPNPIIAQIKGFVWCASSRNGRRASPARPRSRTRRWCRLPARRSYRHRAPSLAGGRW